MRTGDKPRLGMEDRRCEERRGGLNSRGHRSQQKRTEVWRRDVMEAREREGGGHGT